MRILRIKIKVRCDKRTADMSLRRAAFLLYAFGFVLALNLLSSSAFPIPPTVEPCITSSCPKQTLPSNDPALVTSPLRPHALAAASAQFSSSDNTTCASGFAECKTDTGFVDCCDESKVCE